MALVQPEDFGETEVARVYIAGRLPEAQEVERVLSSNGVDYFVEIEPFQVMLLGFLPTEHKGLAFYVAANNAELSCRALLEAGLTQGLVEEQ
jgi:hypothetical protein